MKKLTIKKISEDLNLSRNTVSKVLNGDHGVSDKTKARVLNYAKKYNYSNDTLETKDEIVENKHIAIAVLDSKIEFWNRIIVGISDQLNKAKTSMSLHFINEKNQNTFFDEIKGRKIDGIILLNVFSQNFYKKLNELNVPQISYDLPVYIENDNLKCPAILVDTLNSVKEIVRYLHSKNCKTFGFVGDKFYAQTINDRYNAYLIALDELNIQINKKYFICKQKPYMYYGENELSSELDKMVNFPDVIFCYNDEIALKAIEYLKKKKIKVPEDVSVFGFDNNEYNVKNPKITTVNVSNEEIGKKLAIMLLCQINGETLTKEKLYIESYPVFRKSTI